MVQNKEALIQEILEWLKSYAAPGHPLTDEVSVLNDLSLLSEPTIEQIHATLINFDSGGMLNRN